MPHTTHSQDRECGTALHHQCAAPSWSPDELPEHQRHAIELQQATLRREFAEHQYRRRIRAHHAQASLWGEL